MIRRFFYITIIFSLLISCDIFTTRNPEEPNKPSSSFLAATSPEILFNNFKSSVEEKIIENYISCFVDTSFLKKKFSFIPASGSSAQYPVLNNWTIREERQYFINLISKLPQGKNINLLMENTQKYLFGDSAVYYFDYILTINSNNQLIGGTYKGSAQFKIFYDSREQWSIVEWQDIKKENFLCWSELKGRTAY
ncbi:MAG: hypothetical protein QHH13_10415 [Melioribacter sp.]|uniref:hypothetical protein n=1 Tax=Rosettibacter primus TaxID=3111523 RepID=UPI00247D0DFE|nr:hypothetical protein [Melioribacter sp.]